MRFSTCAGSLSRPSEPRIGRQGRLVEVALARALDEAEREVGVFQRYGTSFGYQFFIMQKRPKAGAKVCVAAGMSRLARSSWLRDMGVLAMSVAA